MSTEEKIREIYKKHKGKHDKVLVEVSEAFGWTIPQAYIATEFLYRPENYN